MKNDKPLDISSAKAVLLGALAPGVNVSADFVAL